VYEIKQLFQRYNPRLDGLRALAVLFVIFFHYKIPGFTGGGYGVDIFFVLSGFLITQVLIKGQEKEESLFVFYWRRFLRLMPALAFMCLSFLIFSLLYSKIVPPGIALQDIFASISYMSNWTRAFSVGIPIIPVVLGNTWSLAIEEQFYLIWGPLFLFLSSKKAGKNILAITTTLLFLSITWSIYAGLHNFGFSRIYNGFDTHCFALIMGCCLALFSQSSSSEKIFSWVSKIWPLAILGLIYLVGFITVGGNYTTYYSLFAGVLTIIIILAAYYAPESLFGKFLGFTPIVAIGKISYGLYLWHYPIWLILYTLNLSWNTITWTGIPLSFFAATVSYQLIEKNLLRFRDSPNLPLKKLGTITVSLSIIGMFVSGIFFLYQPIKTTLFPTPIVIQTYSPYRIKAGDTVNVQADGQSYFYMTTSQKLPDDAKLRIDNQDYNVYLSNNLIATPLSRDLLSKVGKNEVVLISSVGTSLAPPVFFEVLENVK
jgi:peptidoglycan/LPS O-acetylase OafA/YrhL